MNVQWEGLVEATAEASLAVLALSMLCGLVRLMRGPTLPDRVVALDLIALTSVALVAAYAIYSGEPGLLRGAIVLALVAFLGTVAFAYYIERRGSS